MAIQLLTAAGDATALSLHATIISNRVSDLSASGSATASGSAAVTTSLPASGLTDLGIWAIGQPDTAMSRDMSHGFGSDATTGKSWLTASAPTDYAPAGNPLWHRAAYAGVGIKWTNLAMSEKHAFDNVQMERVTTDNRLSWDATSWEGRQCYSAQSNITYCSVGHSTDKALSGSSSGKVTYAGAPAGQFGYWINPTYITGMAPCTAGEIITGSVSISMQRAAWWSVGLQFYDVNLAQIGGGTTWYFSAYQQHPGGGAWDTSYAYSITAPAGAVWVAAVPHISVNSTPGGSDSIAPVGEVAYVDMHKIQARPYNLVGTPTTYTAPRRLRINVKANRVNLINNPGFDADLYGWGSLGAGTMPFPNSWDSTTGRTKPGALKFTVPPNPTSFGLPSVIGPGLLTSFSVSNMGGFGWKPNTTYTTSAYVRLGTNCPAVTLYTSYTPTAGVLNTDDALANHPELIEGDWIRLWGTFTTSAFDNGLVAMDALLTSSAIPSSGATFWLDDVLCEAADQPMSYFDGGMPSADYRWAGTASRSSSHYYRGLRSNLYRLKDIVSSAVPHGTQFDLLYAQPPQ